MRKGLLAIDRLIWKTQKAIGDEATRVGRRLREDGSKRGFLGVCVLEWTAEGSDCKEIKS